MEEVGIGFAGTVVSTWKTLRTLTYTPTSQLETETNAALETTSRLYDGVDRLIEITDPIGGRTRYTFDLAGQQLQEIRGFGSPDPANFATYTYSPNGQRITVKDANNNFSRLVYDGFDRLCRVYFPVTTLGSGMANTGGLPEP